MSTQNLKEEKYLRYSSRVRGDEPNSTSTLSFGRVRHNLRKDFKVRAHLWSICQKGGRCFGWVASTNAALNLWIMLASAASPPLSRRISTTCSRFHRVTHTFTAVEADFLQLSILIPACVLLRTSITREELCSAKSDCMFAHAHPGN